MSFRIALASGLLLAACGGSPPSSSPAATPAANPCAAEPGAANPCAADLDFNPCAGDGAAVDCSDWRNWTRMNAQAFESRGHRKEWVDVFVDPAFADAYRSLGAEAPQGMRVIKAAYADAGGDPGDPSGLTVMVKMAPGYDPDHGDWYYGVFDGSGTEASQQGPLEMCIDCHDRAADTDYLFGTE